MGFTAFISDLHLSPGQPRLQELLLSFLSGPAREASALYILGDLFEYWVGDEALREPFNAAVAQGMKSLRAAGVPLYLMHGNRDFLLGRRFAAAAGAQLLQDPTVLNLYGTPTLLMHGDTLCTEDLAYQRFRRRARHALLQRLFLLQPYAWRLRWAGRARAMSEVAKQTKSMAIMDVAPLAVAAALREHACSRLIHGHTHRPARHSLLVDGRACERLVLADWHGAGHYLRCDASGCQPVELGAD